MNSTNNRNPITLFDLTNNPSELNQHDISLHANFVIDLCHYNYFDTMQSMEIIQNLNKLKNFREHFGYKDHPSLPKILNDIGELIAETSLSELALPFFVEQLRIEKYYLGWFHPDLAFVLSSIGRIHAKENKLEKARKYFMEALVLLNNHKIKGRLYASLTYNIGLVNYRQSFYNDAMENFDVATLEHEAAYGEYHPAVAEICMKIGSLQLEIGRLQDAMDNFIKALMIIRISFGNNHYQAAKCLCKIGLIHQSRNEFKESLNALHQALAINENIEDYDDDGDALTLVILHRIGLLYQETEEIEKATHVFKHLRHLVHLEFKETDAEHLISTFGFISYVECTQAAAAA